MICVCICENNVMTAKKYREMLTKISRKHNIDVNITRFSNGETLLLHTMNHPHEADIIYMDIFMEELGGIETARELRLRGCQAGIIFLSNSVEHVFDVFDIKPVQYLVKGSTFEEKFEKVFLRAVELARQKKTKFLACKFGNSKVMIPIEDIAYIKIKKRLINVHHKGREFRFYSSLEKLEKQLQDKNFIRTHRSYMVNLFYITTFHPQFLVLKTGEEIPVGGTYTNKVKQAFLKLYGKTSSRPLL
ncbi:LytR/AlgR family response regulator transcription factor [Geosporobacter ferrireducens]|uniref:Stage 0 sporulation protein A homolog n=1 Tax=Geosporobacter ferrireducens TaxID=1424294 RepID=A0A1D8GLN9_9FIRM|nr:LytTR family DNA-binding domain-containing protein [Geosporobacter ferrireducens]AOT71821.1 hypothetical protein Gferi_21165 [Geosporobacter ferrireducens]